MADKITQKQAIFYQLYKRHKAGIREHFEIWKLMGEVYCDEVKKWGFVSYEASARLSEMTKENPDLLERKLVTGKTGSTYYTYRINPCANVSHIRDSKLRDLHRTISRL